MKNKFYFDELYEATFIRAHDAIAAVADWIIDLGPGAGEEGGKVIASGPPLVIASQTRGKTARYLAALLGVAPGATR